MSYSNLEQSDKEFLKLCEIKENSLESMLALKLREILYYYSSSGGKKIKNAKYIFADDRINSDIGISHLDSINLIDIILELEKDGISINEEEARIIFSLNEKDSTVAEIINNLLEIIKSRQPNQTL